MDVIDSFVIIFTLAIIALEVIGIVKTRRQAYGSPYITTFRGFKVAALLKEKKIKDERIKKFLYLNSVVDIFLLFVLITLYLSRRFTGDYELVIALVVIAVHFLTQKLVDWRIKKVIKQGENA